MQVELTNPVTGEIAKRYENMSRNRVLAIAARVGEAFVLWRERSLSERAPLFREMAAVLRRRQERYAKLITLEMGKPIREARAEVEKCAWLAEVYADHAADWLAEEEIAADGRRHLITFEPLGVIISIMPWNFPFWQALRFAVPAVIAGNTCLLKHARNVPQCALAIEEAFREAGFPPDAFRTVFADHEVIGELVAGDQIQGVSLTGSTEAGELIAEAAGRGLKKVVLELGGSDPFIVLEDADPAFTARQAVSGRMINAGQSCIAAKRFIVVASLAEDFTRHFAAGLEALTVGDPLDEATQVGPVVDERALVELETQLARSVAAGAKVVTGGKRLSRPGCFFAPTLVTETTPEMPVMSEEVFGPIAPVIVVADEAEAIAVANQTPFGLGGSVWTRDLERGLRLARRIEAGTVFVNSIVKSDPRMPFGGIKKSGIGRELYKYGLREFVNIKGINIYEHG
ncbi:MAG: NAD-dependent succinate-semialdehyde dehydrogenase [Candidatus Eisenbacteria sp.]|nr:NAD-dependent succinate-semialdehyde dehydrogenase [Candidatus Eisenbacteria bacterium]